jgi:hypothetical protein
MYGHNIAESGWLKRYSRGEPQIRKNTFMVCYVFNPITVVIIKCICNITGIAGKTGVYSSV